MKETQTRWTPGPYEIFNGTDIFGPCGGDSGDGVACDENDGWQIAEVGRYASFVDGQLTELGWEVRKANANLLKAAPLMYEALESLMILEARGRVMPIGKEWDAAREALRTARGENVNIQEQTQ